VNKKRRLESGRARGDSKASAAAAARERCALAAMAGLPRAVREAATNALAFLRALYRAGPALAFACLALTACPFRVPGQVGTPESAARIVGRYLGVTVVMLDAFSHAFARSPEARKMVQTMFANMRRTGHVNARKNSQVTFRFIVGSFVVVRKADGARKRFVMHATGTFNDMKGTPMAERQESIVSKYAATMGDDVEFLPEDDAGRQEDEYGDSASVRQRQRRAANTLSFRCICARAGPPCASSAATSCSRTAVPRRALRASSCSACTASGLRQQSIVARASRRCTWCQQ
jgi:hypothetical protein